MKVFALGLDETQKAEKAAAEDNQANETKIPIETVASNVPTIQQPQIVLAQAPRRRYGFTCGLFSWFVGAFCLVLLCLAISEVAYHRQRDQAFLRLKWAELRQRMLGYELLSQQQELDRMALEKQSQQLQQPQQIEALPLRLSKDPIKPQIVTLDDDSKDDSQPAANIKVQSAIGRAGEKDNSAADSAEYQDEQSLKFGFLQTLMDKIRKHAESMGLNGDMQVHVVEVKPIQNGNSIDFEQIGKDFGSGEKSTFDQSMADGFGEYAMPHQDFTDDYEINNNNNNNGRRTFDRQSFRKPFFGPLNRWDNNMYDNDEPRFFGGDDRSRNFFGNPFGPSAQPSYPIFDFPSQPYFPQQQQQQWWPNQQSSEVLTNQWDQNQNQNPWQNQNQNQNQAYYYYPQQQQQNQQFPQQFQGQNEVFPSDINNNNNGNRPWYMPYGEQQQQQKPQAAQPASQPIMWQNDDWMAQKTHDQIPFQPNPDASSFQQKQPANNNKWIDQTASFQPVTFSDNSEINNKAGAIGFDSASNTDPKSSLITMDNVPLVQEDQPKINVKAWNTQPQDDQSSDNAISPDAQLESIDENKFLPIRSDDKPIDSSDTSSHLFQIDDPSSFKR